MAIVFEHTYFIMMTNRSVVSLFEFERRVSPESSMSPNTSLDITLDNRN